MNYLTYNDIYKKNVKEIIHADEVQYWDKYYYLKS